ncbi:radical SAM protein, partial [Streptomyces rubellomurinus subsp. indigoferus]
LVANMRPRAAGQTGALGYSFRVRPRREPERRTVRNHTEGLSAAQLAHDIGGDYFQTKSMFDAEHHVVQVPQDILDSVERQLAEAARLRSDSFQLVNSSTLTSLRRHSGPV